MCFRRKIADQGSFWWDTDWAQVGVFLITLTISRLNQRSNLTNLHWTESVKLSLHSAGTGGQIWTCISCPVIRCDGLGLKVGFSVMNVIWHTLIWLRAIVEHVSESHWAASGDMIAGITHTDSHTLSLGKYNHFQINHNFFIWILNSKDPIFTVFFCNALQCWHSPVNESTVPRHILAFRIEYDWIWTMYHKMPSFSIEFFFAGCTH